MLTLVSDLDATFYLYARVMKHTKLKNIRSFVNTSHTWRIDDVFYCIVYRREFQVVLNNLFVRFNDGRNVNIIEGIIRMTLDSRYGEWNIFLSRDKFLLMFDHLVCVCKFHGK